jgi:hypothetical protein
LLVAIYPLSEERRRQMILRAAAISFLVFGFASIAQAVPITFTASLDGPSESPPVASPGTGNAVVVYDDAAHTLSVEVTFSDLVGMTTVAHIHCCVASPGTGTVGVATYPVTFPGFPAGVTSGTYSSPTAIDLTDSLSYTAGFLAGFGGGTAAGAEAALLAGLLDGSAYFNIHTSFAPGGEIRGFLEQRIPEPATLGLFGAGLAGLAVVRRRRKVKA